MLREVDYYIAEDSKTTDIGESNEITETETASQSDFPSIIYDEFFDEKNTSHLPTASQCNSTFSVPTFDRIKFKPAKCFSDLERASILAEYKSQNTDIKIISEKYSIRPFLLKSWIKRDLNQIPISKTEKKVVESCIIDKISPAKLSKINSVDVRTVRRWVKKSGNALPSKYLHNLETPKPVTVLKCSKPECNFETDKQSILDRHLKSHYHCEHCSESFSGKNAKRNFQNHLKTHQNDSNTNL